MLLFYCFVLTVIVLSLVLKLATMKAGIKEMGREVTSILNQDTNRLIGLSSRDKDLRYLANILNGQLKALQQERHRYQDGDRDLKTAVTNISHDLRTPLTAISGYLELLDREQHSSQTLRCLKIIRNRVDSMKQLTEELFRYSLALTGGELKPEKLSINKLLEESLLSFYETFLQKGITPDISLPETPVMRKLDAFAVSRIFSNIISNAAKYSTEDFCVKLASDGTVIFSNTAPNLTPVTAARLFDRFYTVEALDGATGLGLSIAKHLTERLGGTISSSYQDNRLTITVTFPPAVASAI